MSNEERARLRNEQRRRRKRLAEQSAQEPLPIWPETVMGGRLVAALQRHVAALREEDAHGNRELFLDDVFIAYLLAFFNPTIRSLRTIDDFSQTQQAQRHLSTRRICHSTLSDFNRIADPERLRPIIAELRGALSRKFAGTQPSNVLYTLMKQVLAVDGTFFRAAADVAWAVKKNNQHCQTYRARVDVHVDVHTWLPEVIALPEPEEGEAHRAAQTVKPGAIHLYDRGFGSFELLEAHYEKHEDKLRPHAQFVLRAKTNHFNLMNREERELTEEQRGQGILSDCIAHLAGSQGCKAPAIVMREIVIAMENGETLRLLTNLLDVAPEVIGQLYRARWQIELFFRWLKCYANFDHLISHSRQGVLLNFYVVIIGVMLMYLHTGGRPSKYALVLLSAVAQSGGDLESIIPILRERERQCARDRKSAAARRARKKAEQQ